MPATSRTWSTWSASSGTVGGAGAVSTRSRSTGSTSSNERGSPPRDATTSRHSKNHVTQRWLTKNDGNPIMHTPPLLRSVASTSSGTLRGWSAMARAEL